MKIYNVCPTNLFIQTWVYHKNVAKRPLLYKPINNPDPPPKKPMIKPNWHQNLSLLDCVIKASLMNPVLFDAIYTNLFTPFVDR